MIYIILVYTILPNLILIRLLPILTDIGPNVLFGHGLNNIKKL